MGSSPFWGRSVARRPFAPRATSCRSRCSSTRSSICWFRRPVVPHRPAALAVGASVVTAPAPQQLPGLVPSILPIILPVLLISSHTVVVSMTARPGLHVAMWSALAPYTAVIGNPNLALLLGTGIALWVYARQRTASRADLAEMVETSLMSAGVMILIIAASGGFGVALQATEIGSVIERAFVGQSGGAASGTRSEEHTSELQSRVDIVCRLLLEK